MERATVAVSRAITVALAVAVTGLAPFGTNPK
jgi:hypothetical protein